MSQATFIQKWAEAHSDLQRVIQIERPKKTKPFSSDRELCFSDLSVRYIKYTIIYRKLQECYDHMIQPQKRILIARCLEGVAGRIVELHTELVRLRINEYINLVDVCMDLKVIPAHLELTLSKAVYIDRVQELRQRARFLEYILETMGGQDEAVAEENFLSLSEAVLLIQRNERAFIARRKVKSIKKNMRIHIRKSGKAQKMMEVNVKGIIKFQALWKKYKIRKSIGFIRHENDIFLGMTMPVCKDLNVRRREIENQDFARAQSNDDTLKSDTILKTELYMDSHGPSMVDDMKREIRQWILEYHDLMGNFPQFPLEEEGGSLALFSNKTVKQIEEDIEDFLEASAKSKKKDDGKDKKANKKEAKPQGKEPSKKGPRPFETKPSRFIDPELIPCLTEYDKFWRHKDESDNRQQCYDSNLLIEDIHTNAEGLLRKQVDELVREELVRLEKGIDKLKPGKAKAKKPKKKKEKKKKKKVKDPTAGVPLEDLFKELVLAGIIKRVPMVKLQDFQGTINLMSPSDCVAMEFKHDLGDIRKMIFDYAILPMSSEFIHQRAPYKKSIIMVGPPGSGKKMLVRAICSELGANLIDLSPDNIAGKYPDKAGQKRLIHLVTKVSKLMEPSVIFIDNCDRMFTKKLPPDDTTNPGRLRGDLMKLLKSITPDDRILIVGSTGYPFKASVAPMFKLYERMIFIYPPSCASRFTLWTKYIMDAKGIIHDKLDITSLAKVSQGYTSGDIKHAVIEVLTEKRLKRQQNYPVMATEFVSRLSTFCPVFAEELAEFEHWLLKTPLTKKRQKISLLEGEGQDVSALL